MVSSGGFSKKPTVKIGDFALRKKGREKTRMAKVVKIFSSSNMDTQKRDQKEILNF